MAVEPETLGELSRVIARDREYYHRSIDGLKAQVTEEIRKLEQRLSDDIEEVKEAQVREQEVRSGWNRVLVATFLASGLSFITALILVVVQLT